jgi:hypothetical protein
MSASRSPGIFWLGPAETRDAAPRGLVEPYITDRLQKLARVGVEEMRIELR